MVTLDRLDAAAIVLPVVDGRRRDLLVTLSCDTEDPEPEYWLGDDEDDLEGDEGDSNDKDEGGSDADDEA
jgi:hypothetical protein